MQKKYFVSFVALWLILWANPLSTKAQSSNTSLKQIIGPTNAGSALWTVSVRDSAGNILEEYNSKKLVRPASNLKLLTTAAILENLGPDFTYSTNIYGVGHQEDHKWKGNLIVRGSGDPSISGLFYNKDRFHVFENFYAALDSMGITKIEGNLIGNDSYFDQQPYPKGWSWQDLSFYYGVETSALSFNNNAVDLRVYARGKVGNEPHIEWFPFDTDYVDFKNEQVISPAGTPYDEFYRRKRGTNTILLRSTLPKGYLEKESLSVHNAPFYFLDTFSKYLGHGGISITGNIMVDHQPADWQNPKYTKLVQHRSVPLGKLITHTNKESDNFYTEMLLKTMAANRFDAPGSTDLGLQMVKDFAQTMKMDTTSLEMADGSGMAASTLIKPADITQLLVQLQGQPYYKTYHQSLSIAGVDGSLEKRFRNQPEQGKLYGKTGYLSGVRSLSGYLDTSSGQTLAFSIVTNNYTAKTSYIDHLHEKIVAHLYKKY